MDEDVDWIGRTPAADAVSLHLPSLNLSTETPVVAPPHKQVGLCDHVRHFLDPRRWAQRAALWTSSCG